MPSGHLDRFLETVRPAITDEASDHRAILHAAFAAVLRADFETFGGFISDDVELSIRGFGEIDGTWKGRGQVVAATRENFGKIGSQEPVIQGLVAAGNCIAVLIEEAGVFKTNGEPYHVRGVQWFTFEDGKIQRIEEIIAEIVAGD